MKFTIHRGTHEIGGSCVEVVSGTTRIILDLGMPLVDKNMQRFDSRLLKGRSRAELLEEGILPRVDGLYAGSERGIDAVILSHAHQDHYGLLQFINPAIPVYLSRGTRILIEISDLFIPTKANLRNVVVFKMGKSFRIGDIAVTPSLVDHSAFDASALLIEGDGRRMFYSGDFRGHGRKKVLFDRQVSQRMQDIDCLLLEGSMLGRENGRYRDEHAIELRMVELFRTKSNIAFVFCSSQNIDRLVSIYRAVKRTDSVFVIDLYTAYILDRLSVVSKRLPQYNWKEIKVKYSQSHADVLVKSGNRELLYKYSKSKVEIEDIDLEKQQVVMLMRDNSIFRACLRKLTGLEGSVAIYSMWDGYLTDSFRNILTTYGINYEYAHTSGHAVVDDLRKLADSLNPRYLVPVHTFNPQDYPAVFPNVHQLRDGEQFTISDRVFSRGLLC